MQTCTISTNTHVKVTQLWTWTVYDMRTMMLWLSCSGYAVIIHMRMDDTSKTCFWWNVWIIHANMYYLYQYTCEGRTIIDMDCLWHGYNDAMANMFKKCCDYTYAHGLYVKNMCLMKCMKNTCKHVLSLPIRMLMSNTYGYGLSMTWVQWFYGYYVQEMLWL